MAGTGGASGPDPVSSGGSDGVPPGGGAGSTIGSGGVAGGARGAASGGAGGSAAGAGAGGTGSPGVTCGDGDISCDDFESATVGIFPDSPGWDPNSCASHVIDGSVVRGGSRSLRGGAEQYPACMAHANIAGEDEVYARSWIRLGAPSSESGHEIGVLELGPTLADNPEVCVGVRNNDSVCASAPGVEVTADGGQLGSRRLLRLRSTPGRGPRAHCRAASNRARLFSYSLPATKSFVPMPEPPMAICSKQE
jgi:hypothetical protein